MYVCIKLTFSTSALDKLISASIFTKVSLAFSASLKDFSYAFLFCNIDHIFYKENENVLQNKLMWKYFKYVQRNGSRF